MIDWLLAPFDATRSHEVAAGVAWHGRLMVLAWCVLLPSGVLIARFFKITLKQDWPRKVDNKAWWYAHNVLQYSGVATALIALAIILQTRSGALSTHALLGWSVVALALMQVLGGWVRGSKGGPTDPQPDGSLDGDHYSMTLRRRIFERAHKSLGYAALTLAIAALTTGLWHANAPRWMWITIGAWWSVLITLGVRWQRQGRAIDTYQAIWGPDPQHPGNKMKPIGWGISRRPLKS
jgi:hypothetical protein